MKKKNVSSKMLLLLWGSPLIVALPFVMRASILNSSWNQPAVKPLWKGKFTRLYNDVSEIAFSKSGDTVTVAHFKAFRWNVSTGTPLATVSSSRPLGTIEMLAGGELGVVRKTPVFVRNVQVKVSYRKPKTKSSPAKLAVRSEKQKIFSNRGFDLYDIGSGKKVSSVSLPDDAHKFPAKLFLSEDKQRLALLEEEPDKTPYKEGQKLFYMPYRLRLWSVPEAKLLQNKRITNISFVDGIYDAFTLSADGKQFFQAERDHIASLNNQVYQILMHDRTSNRTIKLPSPKLSDIAGCKKPVFSDDGELLALEVDGIYKNESPYSIDDTICVWNFRTRKLLWTHHEPDFWPETYKFSPDKTMLAIGGSDSAPSKGTTGKLIVLDVKNGKLLQTLTEQSSLDKFHQSRADIQARVSDTITRRSTWIESFPGDSGAVESLEFSPDSKKLAAVYTSGEIKMWKAPK